MATLGLDYASSSPGAGAVKAAGYSFVARYLSRYTAKVITKGEYDDMTGNGVDVVLVFEDYANQALQGYAQGVADAQVALAQANAIGWPSDRPIHFAVDFDISDAQKPAAGEYMKGAASVLGLARTGAYGGYWWIKYCDDNNLAAPNARWQAVAWSGGMVHPTATLFQRLGGVTVNGVSCDVDEALKTDFGQSNGAQNMPSITGLDEARIISYGVGGRNGIEINGDTVIVDDSQNALGGGTDGDLNANHVGHVLDDEVRGWYNSSEGQAWRGERLSELVALAQQVSPLKQQLQDANNKISKLQKAQTPVVTPTKPVAPVTLPTSTPPKIVVGTVQPKQGFWQTLWHNLFG